MSILAGLLGGAMPAGLRCAHAAADEWSVYGGDAAGTKYSSLTQIHRDNVRRLQPAWMFRCEDFSPWPRTTIQCNPLMVDGVLYLTTPGLKVAAVDAAPGARIAKQPVIAFLFGDTGFERIATTNLTLSWAKEIPYVATGHHDFRDPDGYPVNQRPWGTLTAIDLDQGTIRWQVLLGTYPALEARGLPPTGTFNIGGPLVTAGGLVFIGAAMDERFHAFDKATGELLWEFQMEAGGYATPATYSVAGRQYVVLAAGGGGKPGTKAGNAYYAFALPEPKGQQP